MVATLQRAGSVLLYDSLICSDAPVSDMLVPVPAPVPAPALMPAIMPMPALVPALLPVPVLAPDTVAMALESSTAGQQQCRTPTHGR